jgi:hypothetical protein
VDAAAVDADARMLQEEQEKDKDMLKAALKFFKRYVGRIDIVRDGLLEKIYFPYMPFCKYLREKDQVNFHNNVDRTSTKTKLTGLLEQSKNFYDVMKHENDLRPIFRNNMFLRVLENGGSVWVNLFFLDRK